MFVTESSETVDDRVPKPWNKSVVLAVYNDQNRGIYNSESLEVNIQTKAIDRMSENIQSTFTVQKSQPGLCFTEIRDAHITVTQ